MKHPIFNFLKQKKLLIVDAIDNKSLSNFVKKSENSK